MTAGSSITNTPRAIASRIKKSIKGRINRFARTYIINPIANEITKSTEQTRGDSSGESSGIAGEINQIKNLLLTSMHNSQADTRGTRVLCSASAQIGQIFLSTYYKTLGETANKFEFDEIGFKCHSQNSEDGILLYIFSLIGTTNKTAVEICAGAGIECNTANLIINHGWTGLLFDGDANNIAAGKEFYRDNPRCFIRPPHLVSAWITRDNINALIRNNGISGEIDLLSIDIDGNDYWIWEAIDCINPRVVIVECQANGWGHSRAVTIPYQEDFVADFITEGSGCIYLGASLPAFVNLGKKKGYRLVGVERYGFNAFFIRDDIGQAIFPEKSAKDCLERAFKTFAQMPMAPSFYNKPWVDV